MDSENQHNYSSENQGYFDQDESEKQISLMNGQEDKDLIFNNDDENERKMDPFEVDDFENRDMYKYESFNSLFLYLKNFVFTYIY